MRQHGLDAPGARLEAFEPQQRIEPDQPAAGAVQPVDLEGQRIVGVALEPVGDEQHDRALRQHAARPQLVEGVQRRGDAGAARPVRHARRAGGERLVGIALAQRAGDIGQPRAEQERVTRLRASVTRAGNAETAAAVLAHRAGNIEQRHDRRRLGLRARDICRSMKAPPAFMLARKVRRMSIRWPRGCGASRRVRTSSSGSTSRFIASLAAAISAAGHLREILVLQHLAVGHRHAARRARSRALSCSLSSRPENSASWTRVAPACGGCGGAGGACGSIIAIS